MGLLPGPVPCVALPGVLLVGLEGDPSSALNNVPCGVGLGGLVFEGGNYLPGFDSRWDQSAPHPPLLCPQGC